MAARVTSSGCCIAAAPARRQLLARKKAFADTRKPANKLEGGAKPGMPAATTSTRRRVGAIRGKIQALRRLVPRADGEQEDRPRLDELLLHSAGYILRLQMQVEVMQFMVDVLNPDRQ